ncbi:MAG TPA: BON domain-containing protein [Bryobacteraceae bacterium]|nr:BON domain-containing protein [Bryobacteraceae bacterium]
MQAIRTAAVLLLSCVAVQAASLPKPTQAPNRTDSAIEQDLRARLARSKISKNNFQVKVQNGTAILTGRTNIIQHKGVATRLAKNAGARRVDNRIEINEEARQAAVANLEKARRRGALKRSEVTRSATP